MEIVTTARDAAKQRYDELRNVRLKEFMAGFHAISAKLKEMYQVSCALSISIALRLKHDCSVAMEANQDR